MADQASVFDEQTPNQAEQQTPSQEPSAGGDQAFPQGQQQQPAASSDAVFADQLASITNERGEPKYKDLPTALDALKHSQQYIPQVKQENETLKQELERLKAELEQRQSLEETVGRLTAQQGNQTPTPQELQGLTPEQVEQLLDQRLTEREQLQKAQENAQSVERTLVEKYGDKARDVVAAKSQEFGMTTAEMQQWASKNPKAVLALFNAQTTPQGNTSYNSSVNIPPVAPNTDNDLKRPEKSLLRGAPMKDQMEYMRQVREHTNRRLGIDT